MTIQTYIFKIKSEIYKGKVKNCILCLIYNLFEISVSKAFSQINKIFDEMIEGAAKVFIFYLSLISMA